jgi:heme exporter protein A
MLQVSNLTCVRGGRQLFSGVGFEVAPGGLLHLKGTNGAGKTSLLRILCGLLHQDGGDIHWNGAPVNHSMGSAVEAYRSDLFYLGHQNSMQEALTVDENLQFYAALSGQTPNAQKTVAALGELGVRACQHRLVRHLSQGQKRRVALSRLLMTPARLWILDEPFVALDRQAIQSLSAVVGQHLHSGGMVILTSHQDVEIGAGEGAVRPQVVELGA